MNEFELIARFFSRPAPSAVLAGGDDCALLAPRAGCELAVTTDMLVEGRHFFADADAALLGHKALAVNLSDLAAMGATPRWALLAVSLPEVDPVWLDGFANGLYALADRHQVGLVGGDTTRGPRTLTVTAIGEVPAGQAIRRSGARVGDTVWVSGALGDAGLAVAAHDRRMLLSAAEADACRGRLDRPEPRIALGEALRGIATAMIDVSDGLAGDLGHLCAASGVGARVEIAAIPVSPAMRRLLRSGQREVALDALLGGGDDYELCFAAPADRVENVRSAARAAAVEVTPIGEIVAGRAPSFVGEDGLPLARTIGAYDHFRDG